ncbi:MAG: hypothetical protein WCQ21_16885, partial [Verrucomicrobiota bacterium]
RVAALHSAVLGSEPSFRFVQSRFFGMRTPLLQLPSVNTVYAATSTSIQPPTANSQQPTSSIQQPASNSQHPTSSEGT